MQTFKIEFHELGDCIEFLDILRRNERQLRIKLRDVRVEVTRDGERSLFLVIVENLPDSSGDLLLKLLRCSDCLTAGDLSRGGEPLKVNQLLERVGLVPQANMPAQQPSALLLFNAENDEFQRRYTELLQCGCHDVRVGLVQPNADNQYLSHVLFVDSPSKSFYPSVAPSEGGVRAVTCYRLRAAPDCRLYVEWRYEYPFERIEQLYDFDDPRCRAVFCLQDSGAGDAAARQWVRLLEKDADGIFALPDEMLRLDARSACTIVDLTPREPDRESSLSLQVLREARGSTTSLDALEMQIAHHQQAIADMQRDYSVAHALRRESLFLAYVFEQDLSAPDGKPPRLNATFARFLDQPFSQLAKMKYGFYQHPGKEESGLHIVFDSRPEEHGQLLTSLASEVYVQRADWASWELPLYVRRGDDIRPRVEEPVVGEQVRKLLWAHGHPSHEPVLLRSTRGPTHDGEPPWEAIYVRDTRPLSDVECVRFLNDRFSAAVLDFRLQVPEHLENALHDVSVPLNEASHALVKQVDEAIRRRIDDAENRWREVDQRIEEVKRKVDLSDRAVTEADTAINAFPHTWAALIDTIPRANTNLLQPMIVALGKYRQEQMKLETLVEDYHAATENVKHEVETNIANVEGRRRAYTSTERKTDELLRTLAEEVRKFRDEQEETEKKLKQHHDQADVEIAVVRKELDDLKTLDLDLQTKKRNTELLHENVKREQIELEKSRKDLEKEEKGLAAARERLARDREDYRARLGGLNGERARLKDEERRVAELAGEVERQQTDYNAEKKRLYEEYTELKKRHAQAGAELAAVRKELEGLKVENLGLQIKKHDAEQLREDITREQEEVEKSKRDLENEVQGLDAAKTRLVRDREDSQARLGQLSGERARLEEEKRRVAGLTSKVEKQQVDCDAEKKRLLEEYKGHQARLIDLQEKFQNLQDRRDRMAALVDRAAKLVTSADPRDGEPGKQPGALTVKVANQLPEELLKALRDRHEPH
jgi:hypothetical protein